MSETIEAVIADDEPKVDIQRRKILEEGRRRELIERYESGGSTQVQFARREGAKYHTFAARLGWHRRAGSKKVVKAEFVEARLLGGFAASLSTWMFRAWSATNDFSRRLPPSSSFIRRASDSSISS